MVFQYRHIPQENVATFIERETTYWQKVAQKAVDDGKLGFWGLFEKVGVYDAPNTSNFLFINTFPDVDAEGIWNPAEVFPNMSVEDMETMSLGEVTSQIFVAPESWVDGANATPEEDYNYVVMNYFDAPDVGAWLEMENTVFMPWITEAMKDPNTSQCAWGNARILAPLGGGMNATTISMDLFPSLHHALRPQSPNTMSDEAGEAISAQWNQLRSPHHRVVYRVVAVVSGE